MKCLKCGGPTQMQVLVSVSAPGELYRQLSKPAYRRKDVSILGVLWETADFICEDPKCGQVTNGYGNYVTNLEQKVRQLEAQVSRLSSSTGA